MTQKKIFRVGVYGVVLRETSILLVHKGPKDIYRGLYDLPGGGIEKGENPEQALRREFFEEVGMSFGKMHLLDNLSHSQDNLYEDPSFTFHQFGHIYVVHHVQASPYYYAQDEFGWYDFASLRHEQLTPFAREIVHRLQTGKLAHVFTCC